MRVEAGLSIAPLLPLRGGTVVERPHPGFLSVGTLPEVSTASIFPALEILMPRIDTTTAAATILPERAFHLPPVVTFNWTELRLGGLVGMDGEDLGVSGVRLRGNLASVAGSEHLAGKAGEVRDDLPGRWFARDIHGTLWVMLSPVERAWERLEPYLDEDCDDPYRAAVLVAFDNAVAECGGEYLGGGAYTFPAAGGEWIFWEGSWEFYPEN